MKSKFTKTDKKFIADSAENDALESYRDSSIQELISSRDVQPDESLINALGIEAVVSRYNLHSWDNFANWKTLEFSTANFIGQQTLQ